MLRADAWDVAFAENVRATEQETVAVTRREKFLSEFKAAGAIAGLLDIRLFTDVKSGDVSAFLMVDVAIGQNLIVGEPNPRLSGDGARQSIGAASKSRTWSSGGQKLALPPT